MKPDFPLLLTLLYFSCDTVSIKDFMFPPYEMSPLLIPTSPSRNNRWQVKRRALRVCWIVLRFIYFRALCCNGKTGCLCYDGSIGPGNVSDDTVLAGGKCCSIRAKGEVVGHLHFEVAAFFSVLLHWYPRTGVDTRFRC